MTGCFFCLFKVLLQTLILGHLIYAQRFIYQPCGPGLRPGWLSDTYIEVLRAPQSQRVPNTHRLSRLILLLSLPVVPPANGSKSETQVPSLITPPISPNLYPTNHQTLTFLAPKCLP